MDCKNIRDLIQKDIEGNLSPEKKTELQKHLSDCGTCSSYADELRVTMSGLRGLEQLDPPPWLAAKVMAKIRAEAPEKKGWIQRLFFPLHIKVPLEAMAVILVAALAVVVMREMEPVTETMIPAPQAERTEPHEQAEQTVQRSADEQKRSDHPPPASESVQKENVPAVMMDEQRPRPETAEKKVSESAGAASESAGSAQPKYAKPETAMRAAPAPAMSGATDDSMAKSYEEIKLMVRDIEEAAKDVIELVKKMGGSAESVRSTAAASTIHVILSSDRDQEFRDRLLKIGKMVPVRQAVQKKTGNYRILLEKS